MAITLGAHGNRFASMGQTVSLTIDPDEGTVALRAPFYCRTTRIDDISSVEWRPDDGRNHGPLNWFVVGRATSPQGVRLNTGGTARVDIATTDGRRYAVVLDTAEQAAQAVDAIRAARR